MLVNMSVNKKRQLNSFTCNTNGIAMPFTGISASFSDIFANQISYSSPTSIKVTTP